MSRVCCWAKRAVAAPGMPDKLEAQSQQDLNRSVRTWLHLRLYPWPTHSTIFPFLGGGESGMESGCDRIWAAGYHVAQHEATKVRGDVLSRLGRDRNARFCGPEKNPKVAPAWSDVWLGLPSV